MSDANIEILAELWERAPFLVLLIIVWQLRQLFKLDAKQHADTTTSLAAVVVRLDRIEEKVDRHHPSEPPAATAAPTLVHRANGEKP